MLVIYMPVGAVVLITVVIVACVFGLCWLLRKRWLRIQKEKLSEDIFKLLEAAEFTEQLIENSPHGVLVVDQNMAIVLVNKTYCRMTGRTKEDFIAKTPPFPGWVPEKKSVIEEYVRKALNGEAVSFEIPVMRKDESRFPALFKVESMRTKEGKKYYFANILDLTEQKKAEAALQESETRFRTAVESLPFQFFMLDRNGRYIMENTVIRENWGGILGKRPDDLNVEEETIAQWKANHRRALDGETVEGEISYKIMGKKRVFHNIVSPVYTGNDVTAVMGINIDITKLVETERSLRNRDLSLQLVLEHLPSMLWCTDRDLRITLSMGSGLSVVGLKPGELVGKTLYEHFDTDDPAHYAIYTHLKALGGEKGKYEAEWGGLLLETTIEPLKDEKNQIIGCIGFAYDVTERKLVENEAKRSREQLRALAGRLHDAREEESAAIAREIHDELGQALTGLKWELSRLGRQIDGDKAGVDLSNIKQKIDEMAKGVDATIGSVREISTQLRPPILDDHGLVGAIEWQTEVFQKKTHVDCEIRKFNIDDAGVELDIPRSTAAFRIFQEILTNVGSHAQARKVEIDLIAETDSFCIEVRDNGKGMPVGEPTFQEGLGILGMRERALVFGGEVTVNDNSPTGTKVRVVIPYQSVR